MTDVTLTAHELAAPFKIQEPDPEPLPKPTRIGFVTEGDGGFRYLQYVRHHEVEAYIARGWVVSDDLSGTHHGRHAQLLEWRGEGEPE